MNEVALAVDFRPVPELTNGQLGRFWDRLIDDFPAALDLPRYETPPGAEPLEDRSIVEVAFPRQRLQMRGSSNERFLQIQHDRLIYNWLRTDLGGEHLYPGYAELAKRFERWWSSLDEFLGTIGSTPAQPTRWELVYVNLVEQGDLWEDWEDLGRLFPSLFGVKPGLEGATFRQEDQSWVWELPEAEQELRVRAHHLVGQGETPAKALRLELLAHGRVKAGESLPERLASGHETIVRSFASLASPTANSGWGIRR